jgi:hypothetical protein
MQYTNHFCEKQNYFLNFPNALEAWDRIPPVQSSAVWAV